MSLTILDLEHQNQSNGNGVGHYELFQSANILVVGDVMIDRYLNGQIDRISPEAPVPVVNLQTMSNRLGGAANVALNIKALGSTPYLCSVIGDDKYGALFQELLIESGISAKYVTTSNNRKTTVKTRVMASNQHVIRIDEEDTFDLGKEEKEDFLTIIKELMDQKEIHAILFQDYNKGVLTTEVIREIILEGIKRDIPTLVDPKHKNFWEYKRVTLFKPNFREVTAKLPFELTISKESMKKAAEYIRQKLGNQYTMITLSDKGIFIDNPSNQILPTQKRDIADVCGAGDAVISTVAVGLANKFSMEEIAKLANIAGGQVCEKVGVVAVNQQQLAKEYKSCVKK